MIFKMLTIISFPKSFHSNQTIIEDKNETTIKGTDLLMNCFFELLLI